MDRISTCRLDPCIISYIKCVYVCAYYIYILQSMTSRIIVIVFYFCIFCLISVLQICYQCNSHFFCICICIFLYQYLHFFVFVFAFFVSVFAFFCICICFFCISIFICAKFFCFERKGLDAAREFVWNVDQLHFERGG